MITAVAAAPGFIVAGIFPLTHSQSTGRLGSTQLLHIGRVPATIRAGV